MARDCPLAKGHRSRWSSGDGDIRAGMAVAAAVVRPCAYEYSTRRAVRTYEYELQLRASAGTGDSDGWTRPRASLAFRCFFQCDSACLPVVHRAAASAVLGEVKGQAGQLPALCCECTSQTAAVRLLPCARALRRRQRVSSQAALPAGGTPSGSRAGLDARLTWDWGWGVWIAATEGTSTC